METATKTPVAIVQEFIALHTTRKEAAERLQPGGPQSAAQSEGFIAELLEELSNYGDAVMASVDRENAYQARWNDTLGKIDTLPPEEATRTFEAMEVLLKESYQTTLENNTDLPESLQNLLRKQAAQL